MDRTQYVKIYTDQPQELRWSLLSDTDRAIWVEVLCLSKSLGLRGSLPPLRDAAFRLRRDPAILLASLQHLAAPDVGWMEQAGDEWRIPGWERWQYDAASDADRKRAQRERDRARSVTTSHDESRPVTTSHGCHATETETETETKEEEKKEEKSDLPSDVPPVEVIEVELVVDSPDKVPIVQIVEAYHQACCPPMPRVAKLTERRRAYIRARWHEASERQSAGWWQEYFEHCADSTFLRGEGEGRDGRPPFIADLEWLVRPENMVKVLEGKYHRQSRPEDMLNRTQKINLATARWAKEHGL